MSCNPKIVRAFFVQSGLPVPAEEHVFHPERKWRFDLAWPAHKLALEVQGGIWTRGRHNRGAALLREWEKLNEAAALGWRLIYCQPLDLCRTSTVNLIKRCLNQNQ